MVDRMMMAWEKRAEYFKTHGPKPKEPYIVRRECGCYEIWHTPDMGEHFMCERDSWLDEREMRALQNRRYAAAGLPKPWVND